MLPKNGRPWEDGMTENRHNGQSIQEVLDTPECMSCFRGISLPPTTHVCEHSCESEPSLFKIYIGSREGSSSVGSRPSTTHGRSPTKWRLDIKGWSRYVEIAASELIFESLSKGSVVDSLYNQSYCGGKEYDW